MAEGQRMTAAREAVEKMMLCEHADVVRESVAAMVAELIEAEVAEHVGAEHGERAPERRAAQRNGYRTRAWKTRAGELELAIPKLRSGPAYFPSFLEPRKRSEQALVAVVQEAYVNGVSTRKLERLVEQLGIAAMGKDQVSRLCAALDDQVSAFRERPLEGPATSTCGWTPRSSGSASAAGCARSAWSSPTACTRPAAARSSAWTSARARPRPSGASSCAAFAPGA